MVEQEIIYLNYHVPERNYRESYGIGDGTEERNNCSLFRPHSKQVSVPYRIKKKKNYFP